MEAIPIDDAKTFEMLARGDSIGVFQLESEGMREAMRKVRPTEFDDIVALVSLYRPGAMRYIDDYASGKRDPSSVTYADERLRAITETTYGCCLYQEQLMEIAKQIAGFSPAEADDLRKAVGKKKRDLMATMEGKFLEGTAASGTAHAVAKNLWSLMTAAADYSFNSSHAACYALIAYRTAYLKANYPRRVHGGRDLLGDVDQGQGARSSSTAATRWASRCCRPTSTPPTTASSSAAARSASGSTRSRTSATRRSRRSSPRASPAARSSRSGTSASASTAGR